MSPLDHPRVRHVAETLDALGAAGTVQAVAETTRSAEEAAAALGVPLGAIVKSLVFLVGRRPVMALVAGDRRCDAEALPAILGIEGAVARADADAVRAATGFAIGGVAPVGHPAPLPTAIDASLGRFPTVYAAAGHPHCVFPTTLDELERITPGVVSGRLAPA